MIHICHTAYTNESCHISTYLPTHLSICVYLSNHTLMVFMSHIAYTNASCHISTYLPTHLSICVYLFNPTLMVLMSHTAYKNESCHISTYLPTHLSICVDLFNPTLMVLWVIPHIRMSHVIYLPTYLPFCVRIYLSVHTLMVWMSHAAYTNASCHTSTNLSTYGVATISRLLKTIGLFCKRAL